MDRLDFTERKLSMRNNKTEYPILESLFDERRKTLDQIYELIRRLHPTDQDKAYDLIEAFEEVIQHIERIK